MEKYMGGIIIGGYFVDNIEMYDDATCCLYFENFEEGDKLITIIVEKWLDDDSWHFVDNYYALNGYFIDSEDTTHLTEDDKEECKKFINEWLKESKC